MRPEVYSKYDVFVEHARYLSPSLSSTLLYRLFASRTLVYPEGCTTSTKVLYLALCVVDIDNIY
jgi:hypothetical protein